MALIKCILSFSDIFTAKVPKAGGDPKFGALGLLPPDDPQLPALLAEVEAAKANTFPSGVPANSNICLDLYERKVASDKSYYDPRFVGWYAFSCSAKQTDKPAVVDMAHIAIIDPSQVYSGMVVFINAGISGYVKGTGGVGGWLNGVMSTGELGQFGRIDGKPTVEQMFAGVAGGAAPAAPAAPAPAPAAPAPAAPVAAAPVAAAPVAAAPVAAAPVAAAPATLQMTTAAEFTYEQYMAAGGWTDDMLVEKGLAIRPSFA